MEDRHRLDKKSRNNGGVRNQLRERFRSRAFSGCATGEKRVSGHPERLPEPRLSLSLKRRM
jgi:hypothetical protein